MYKSLLLILFLHIVNGLKCYTCNDQINAVSKQTELSKHCAENKCEKWCLTLAVQDQDTVATIFYFHKCFPFDMNMTITENEENVCRNILGKSNFTHCTAKFCSTDLCNDHRKLLLKEREMYTRMEGNLSLSELKSKFNLILEKYANFKPFRDFGRVTEPSSSKMLKDEKHRKLIIAIGVILMVLGILAILTSMSLSNSYKYYSAFKMQRNF